ncbi:MAG: DUF4234 domain-containing protein [Clostridia bacterium]|nr:DUF4234 domain-containing protein [Clostridia bacterium]
MEINNFDLGTVDFGSMDFGALAFDFFGSYLSTVVAMAGLVFVCICASKYKQFKHDKKMKNMFIAGTVLLIGSIVLPMLAVATMTISAFVMMVTDAMSSGLMTAVMSSALLTTVLSVFSWLMKIGGCVLVAMVFFGLNQKKQQTADESHNASDAEQTAWQMPSEDENPENRYENMQSDFAQNAYQQNTVADDEDAFMSLGTLIVLWLLTLGIGYMYWVYRMTEYLNRVNGSQRMNPVAQCLLCGFVPFYSIYWFYIHGQKLEAHLKANGKNENIATLCLILGIFCPFAGAIIMQDHCNKLAGR